MSLRDIVVEFREIPITLIDAPELPARAGMADDKMDELVADIKVKGVLVPISVVRVSDRYEVIAGHRRRVAAERAYVPTIRCLVYPTKDSGLEAIKWSENRFREEMSASEEAVYFAQLLERDCGGDTNRLCELLGEKRSYVEGRLLLFQGATEVLDALARRVITIGVAHELNKCTEKLMRDYYLDRAIREGASVSLVTGWIQQWRSSLGPAGAPPPCPATEQRSTATTASSYFTCYVCGKTHNPHAMVQVCVHASCKEAILDPLLQGDPPPDPRRI